MKRVEGISETEGDPIWCPKKNCTPASRPTLIFSVCLGFSLLSCLARVTITMRKNDKEKMWAHFCHLQLLLNLGHHLLPRVLWPQLQSAVQDPHLTERTEGDSCLSHSGHTTSSSRPIFIDNRRSIPEPGPHGPAGSYRGRSQEDCLLKVGPFGPKWSQGMPCAQNSSGTQQPPQFTEPLP